MALSIQATEIVETQIERLDTDHDEMIKAERELTDVLFSKGVTGENNEKDNKEDKKSLDFFLDYDRYHKAMSNFARSIIPLNPFLPNNLLPIPPGPIDKKEPEEESSLAETLKEHKAGVAELIVIGLPIIPLCALAALNIVPYTIPVLYSVGCLALLRAPVIAEWWLRMSKKKDMEEDNGISENPTEWIAKELQIMSDKYDAIRGLIMAQNVKKEQLSSKYGKMELALFSRLQQEREFFPTECLNVIRKIMVYSNNAYYERKAQLISVLKAQQHMQQLPQYPAVHN